MTKTSWELIKTKWVEDVEDSTGVAWVLTTILGATTSRAEAGMTRDTRTLPGAEWDSLT